MGAEIFSLLFVLLFSLSSHFLIRSVMEPIDWARLEFYSKRALRLERSYKILAWSVLTAFLFYSMLLSFIQSFGEALG